MDRQVRLRPFEESDLALLARLESDRDAAGEFQWFGFRMDKVRELERRWQQDGLIGDESGYLVVDLDDGPCVGLVDWRRINRFGNYEIVLTPRDLERILIDLRALIDGTDALDANRAHAVDIAITITPALERGSGGT